MVATRRAARQSEPTPSSLGSNPPMHPSMEGSTSGRATRSRSKVNSQPDIISESHLEKMKESKAKPDAEDHLEVQATQNKCELTHLADSVAELQADGYISEADSNCSSVTSLQLPFIRVTRRRKIVVPFQLESPAKNRPNRRLLPSEDSKCQDDDVSESESCCSTVSGVQASSAPRMTRSGQAKTNISPVHEAQADVVSDAESWCSGVSAEPAGQFKRMTRSMRLRPQAETVLEGERRNEIVVGDEKLPQNTTKSQTIIISDTEPTRSDVDNKLLLCASTTKSNEQPSPCKPKNHSESISGGDLKQRFSSSSKKTARKCSKTTPKKEIQNDRDCEIVDYPAEKIKKNKNIKESARKEIPNDVYETVESTEEMCDQTSEKPRKATEKLSPGKCTSTFLGQTTPNKDKHNMETISLTQGCVHQAEEIIDVDKLHETGNPQNAIIPSQVIESSDEDCRVSVVSIDSDESQEEPVAESSLGTAKQKGDEGCSIMSPFIIDESSEDNSSDLEETHEMNMTANCADSCKQTALALDTSHSEMLFVIDKTPGLHPTKTYYLEEDTGNDGEGTKSKKSSELEEEEEEFIDEDEDSLNVTKRALSLSSSIDPGLNLRDLGGLYIYFDAAKQKPGSHRTVPLKEKKKDELLQRSTITPDFEKKECVPPLRESVHQLKKQRRAEREKTTGDGWFGMKAPEMTDELKNDLQALKLRTAIDPKHFYKKNDREGLPKYFQVGTVVDSPVDFYHARIPKKERKKTIVEELLADAEFRRYNKRKYKDIMAEKAALAAGKKNKKKKKFHK